MYFKDTDFWIAAFQIAQQSRLEAALASAFRQQETGSGITMRQFSKRQQQFNASTDARYILGTTHSHRRVW